MYVLCVEACTPSDDPTGECVGLKEGEYKIVHASGERCLEYKKDGSCVSGKFARKVLITPHKFTGFPNPLGFGRIKLWD